MSELATDTAQNGHTDEQPDLPVREAPPSSQIARLRERRDALQGEHTVDLDIPGYDGELVCRYKLLGWGELKKIAERVDGMRDFKRELLGQADTLIAACDSFWVRAGDSLEPLDPDDPAPIRYDERLGKALGFDASRSARSAVIGLMVNELAVTAHHNELVAWMQGVSPEVDKKARGGILEDEALGLAATASLLGLDGWAALAAGDPFDWLLLEAFVKKALQVRELMDKNLAAEISNAVWKAVRKG